MLTCLPLRSWGKRHVSLESRFPPPRPTSLPYLFALRDGTRNVGDANGFAQSLPILKRVEVAAEMYAEFVLDEFRPLFSVLLASLLPVILDGEAAEFGSYGGCRISVEVGKAVEATHV
jgi:hypothetical protein